MSEDRDDIRRTSKYDEASGRMYNALEWDAEPVLRMNHAHRQSRPEHGRYKGNMVHVGRLHLADIERLQNMGYDLLSPDPDERHRALLYVQQNEKHLLTVPGRPFALRKMKWV